MNKIRSKLEERRSMVQARLDADKEQSERNRMGQFATPAGLALDMLREAKKILNKNEIVRFIDPAVGTGSFYSALLEVFPMNRIGSAVGYEIAPDYGEQAIEIWAETGLEVRLNDFTQVAPPTDDDKFNLLICNPPYVRHHHIVNGEKQRLKGKVKKACGMEINGLAGLYCYFLGLSHEWMANSGLAVWLIPSEFMDVNYGVSVKRYLLRKVTLLHIHRFDPKDIQFGDALVSSAVVCFRKEIPPQDHEIRFTYGGSLEQPQLQRLVSIETLCHDPKWTRYPLQGGCKSTDEPVLDDFFNIKRGLATGNNNFFILSGEEIILRDLPAEVFKPILPSPRYLSVDEIQADCSGNPVLERRLFLLDCQLEEAEIQNQYPKLWDYLNEGKANGISEGYICRHRTLWYKQETRPSSPFVCTYIGRGDAKNGRPFRFILNHSQATVSNVYLILYPKDSLKRALMGNPTLKTQVWQALNEISPKTMVSEGRVYGGGMHKLEPKELGNVPVAAIAELLPELVRPKRVKQVEIFKREAV